MSETVVLIVEDELLLRFSAAQIAEETGFTVLEAANADEAIKLVERRRDNYRGVHRYQYAGIDGWSEAGARHT